MPAPASWRGPSRLWRISRPRRSSVLGFVRSEWSRTGSERRLRGEGGHDRLRHRGAELDCPPAIDPNPHQLHTTRRLSLADRRNHDTGAVDGADPDARGPRDRLEVKPMGGSEEQLELVVRQ